MPHGDDRVTVFTTASGHKIDFLKPELRMRDLADLAASLSEQPRYAGQTSRPYSVAQHCLFVADLVPDWALHALIHDAPEAFMCDLPTPLKEAMRALADGESPYDVLEDRFYGAVCKALDIDFHRPVSVHLADEKARKYEMPALHPAFLGKTSHKSLERILDLPRGGKDEWLRLVLQEKSALESYRARMA